jgi:hypothetical protein
MQDVNAANAQILAHARQLLDSCSRTVTVTRLQPGSHINAFEARTSAFPVFVPGLHGADAPANVLPAASDVFPTPLFNDGVKMPENFNTNGEDPIPCWCGCDLLGAPPPADEIEGDWPGELAVGQSVTLRQLMCRQLQPGTGAMLPLDWAGGGHYFPHVFHSVCLEKWFQTLLQQHQQPTCPTCRAVFGNQMGPAPMVRLPRRGLRCLPHGHLCLCARVVCRPRASAT